MVLVVLKIIYKLNCGFYYITLIFHQKMEEKLSLGKLIRKFSQTIVLFFRKNQKNLHKNITKQTKRLKIIPNLI